MNRQESHRIYLQIFAPRSASNTGNPDDVAATLPILHRHDSHVIHPPNYPATMPGAPYQFNSSSDSSQSSYSFSSLSTNTTAQTHSRHDGQTSQSGSSIHPHHPTSSTKTRFVGYPSTVTTSAAVRLTDKARASDVTALLRGKFGLPPILSIKVNSSGSGRPIHHSSRGERNKVPTRLSQVKMQRDGHRRYSLSNAGVEPGANAESDKEGLDEVDALVLVGTLDRPPKGYLRFEHEEFIEEQQRLKAFRNLRAREECDILGQQNIQHPPRLRQYSEDTVVAGNNQQHVKVATDMARLPVSESAATVQASGAQPGWVSSMLLAPSASGEGSALSTNKSEDNVSPLECVTSRSTSTIGLDLSSSRSSSAWGGGGGNRITPWGRGIGAEGTGLHKEMDYSSSRGKLTTLVSELSASPSATLHNNEVASTSPRQPKLRTPSHEQISEPIHVVRTVLPDEHPLHVRDEMISLLNDLRQKAEEEMGSQINGESIGDFQRKHPQPTFRWYFQPCSPLGGVGSTSQSSKIQSIPAYIDVEGYCTEDESESEHEDEDDINQDGGGFVDSHSQRSTLSFQMRQLMEEKQRIAVLRDLADPPFLVSGYLMKQSWRDPNVWRRVYCVLSEDRMWIIGRMKMLNQSSGSDEMLSSLRVGRHKYIRLHRSLLLERGEGGTQSVKQYSSSRYSGYCLTPLGHRLPHTFRMLTSQGKSQCHTFRAYNSQSFRVWVSALSEKIAQKHGDGMMSLADVIAEEETSARCRRMDDIAIAPLESLQVSVEPASESMDIVRFGIAVAAFRELCRHVNDAIRQQKNHGLVNVQTKVGGGHRTRQLSSVVDQQSKSIEHASMVSAVWEDARLVASKSAQLLHKLAALEHHRPNKLENDEKSPDEKSNMEGLVEEQKGIQTLLGKHWGQEQSAEATASGYFSLPPMHLFDSLLDKLQLLPLRLD